MNSCKLCYSPRRRAPTDSMTTHQTSLWQSRNLHFSAVRCKFLPGTNSVLHMLTFPCLKVKTNVIVCLCELGTK